MTQQQNAGMWLCQTAVTSRREALWPLQTGISLLSCAVLLLAMTGLTGIRGESTVIVVLSVAALFSLFYGITWKTDREGWFFLGILVLVLAVTVVCRRQVLEGFRICWNASCAAMVRGTGWVIPEWELQLPAAQAGLCSALFAGLVGCLVSLICSALASFAPIVLAGLLPAALLGGMMLFGADEGFVWLLPGPGASVLIFLCSGWRRSHRGSPVMFNWIACALAACLLVTAASLPGMQRLNQTVRDNARRMIHEKTYETDYSTLPEGDFTQYRAAVQTPQPALAVTMEDPRPLYLRGFTGAVFEENRWQPLDRTVLAQNRELLYWLNLNTFDLNAQFDAAAALVQTDFRTVTVQNIGACSFYRYVPFSVSKGTWAQAENLNTEGVYADGERSYVYSVSTGDILQVLNHLQTSEDPAVLEYRKAESAYRQFVYWYYLQVPEEITEILSDRWDAVATPYGDADNLTQQQARECALIFLSRCFPKEGTPAETELPLDMAEGTSFQYATVAAMTLRYFGIPARYAEGYVITEEMAAEADSGETLTVDSSCARAWVEVYQDGIGWIPMELAPGMGEMIEPPDQSDRNGGSGTADQDAAQDPEELPDEEEEPEPDGGTVLTALLKTVLAALLIGLLLLVLVFMALLLRRRILQKQKQQRFQCEPVNDAAAWIFADTAEILHKLGFDRGNGSMRSLREAIEHKYGGEFAALYEQAVDLNDRALFSSRMMDETHRQTVLCFRNRTVQQLKSEAKWYRRLWFQWVLCLY